MKIVALVTDLMDRSRFGAHNVEFVGDAALLPKLSIGADLVIVDLSRPGAIDALPAVLDVAKRVVAYGSHVDTDALAAANKTAATTMARSRFFRSLDTILAGNGQETSAKEENES